MGWFQKLTSEETRSFLRNAAKLVLEFTGDEGEPAKAPDIAAVASAVSVGASVAERVVAAARSQSKRSRGNLALSLALGAAVGAGILYLASPKGRAKARELFHRARGWRKPTNGAPVEIPPPV